MQYICVECGGVVRAGQDTPPQHCGAFMTRTEIPEALTSVYGRKYQYIYHVIWEHEPIIGIDIVHIAEYSPGTVYPALKDLECIDVITHRPVLNTSGNGQGKQWATTPDAFEDHTPDNYEPLTP